MDTKFRNIDEKLSRVISPRQFIWPLLCCAIIMFSLFFSSCQKPKPTEMRGLVPVDALVYLESRDLGQMLKALTQNKAYRELADKEPDFSTLNNIQVAIVVMGFETSEKQVTEESSILNFKPRFALIADTHASESTALLIAESQIGNFIKKTYGGDVKLGKSEKAGATMLLWTSNDGRKLISAVAGSIIYVGNDETIIDKCLAVKSGETESLLKNESAARARERSGEDALAFGYVSHDGAAQIANLASMSVAINAGEEELLRGFIARTLPIILQKSVTEIFWTARKTDQGIEDKISAEIAPEVSSVLKETLIPNTGAQFPGAIYLPEGFSSISRYRLQNANLAWQSILLTASNQIDPASGKILTQVSNQFFEPYGIIDARGFLDAAGPEIVTAVADDDGDKSIVIADVKDEAKLFKSITPEIDFRLAPEKAGSLRFWKSKDDELAAAITEGKLILGDRLSVVNCLKAKETGANFSRSPFFQAFTQNQAATVTITRDTDSAAKVVAVLGNPKDENKRFDGFFITQTRFEGNAIERKTVSDFGLIGSIIEQFEN